MKHPFTGMLIVMMLVLTMVVGAVALAENLDPQMPPVEQAQPEQAPAAPEAPAADAASDADALQDAIKAYNDAKTSSRQEALEAELKDFVESGKLTQEQADLILNYAKEQQSLRDGTCPNCGYQLQNGQGRGGRMNGGFCGRGNRMNDGFGGKGSRGMMDRQPSGNQSTGSVDGMSQMPGAESMPEMPGNDGI